ncbi:hypothetical protein Trco_000804 [Trichoderma cornu-damae]|uniref:Uncharacterized protein n=1 Tax=Trichoderma cornu-damae TaxID=654480 RepID=A0A9P8QT25_9HYPO|nr:hypothetical protein Trco_000804 [Trichoderma cornu-damae]
MDVALNLCAALAIANLDEMGSIRETDDPGSHFSCINLVEKEFAAKTKKSAVFARDPTRTKFLCQASRRHGNRSGRTCYTYEMFRQSW